MAVFLSLEQSNKADWSLQISATDADTGDAIDFTGATVDLKVNDENGCLKLEASTGNGKVTFPSTGIVQFAFPASEMKNLCAGSYPIGAVYQVGGATYQLLIGSIQIYDGIANL